MGNHDEGGHDEPANDTGGHDEGGLKPVGAEGPQLKQKLTQEKGGDQAKLFDPGASMLGTDNEAGAPPDQDEMAVARNAPPPK